MTNQQAIISRELTQAAYANDRNYRGGFNINELRACLRDIVIKTSSEGEVEQELLFLEGRSDDVYTPEIREWMEVLVEDIITS